MNQRTSLLRSTNPRNFLAPARRLISSRRAGLAECRQQRAQRNLGLSIEIKSRTSSEAVIPPVGGCRQRSTRAAKLESVHYPGNGAVCEADPGTELSEAESLGMRQGLHNDALRTGQSSSHEFHFQRFPQPLPDHAEVLVDFARELMQRLLRDCSASRFFRRLSHLPLMPRLARKQMESMP